MLQQHQGSLRNLHFSSTVTEKDWFYKSFKVTHNLFLNCITRCDWPLTKNNIQHNCQKRVRPKPQTRSSQLEGYSGGMIWDNTLSSWERNMNSKRSLERAWRNVLLLLQSSKKKLIFFPKSTKLPINAEPCCRIFCPSYSCFPNCLYSHNNTFLSGQWERSEQCRHLIYLFVPWR